MSCTQAIPYPKDPKWDKVEQESDSRETKYRKHHGSEVCVEPNDAERHTLPESDSEISELKSEILALEVEGKTMLNIKWNVTSLFLRILKTAPL